MEAQLTAQEAKRFAHYADQVSFPTWYEAEHETKILYDLLLWAFVHIV